MSEKTSSFTILAKDAVIVANELRICVGAGGKLVIAYISSGTLGQVPVADVVGISLEPQWDHCHNCDQSLSGSPIAHPAARKITPTLVERQESILYDRG